MKVSDLIKYPNIQWIPAFIQKVSRKQVRDPYIKVKSYEKNLISQSFFAAPFILTV